MAQNIAANSLSALLSLSGNVAQAEDSEQALDRLGTGEEQTVSSVGESGERAKFALPEALATGIGAGFILGPVGGAILAGAQGILGKQARQGAIDRAAAQSEAIQGAYDVYSGQFESLRANAETPYDLDQLSNIETAFDVAKGYATSGDPALQALSVDMMNAANGELQAYTQRQESESYARVAADEQLRRDMDNQTYTRHTGLLANFDRDSAGYRKQTAGIANAREAFNRGDSAAITAGISMMAKMIDPEGGAVTEGETAAWQGLGNRLNKVSALIDRELGSGAGMTDATRREVLTLIDQFERTSNSVQMAREKEYADRVQDAGIPSKYWDNYQLTNKVPAAHKQEFVSNREAILATGGPGIDESGNIVEPLLPDPGNVFESANEVRLRQAIPAPVPVLNPRARPTN